MSRVTTQMTFQRAVLDIRRNQVEIARLQSGVGSGKRVQRPSDDPAAASRALGVRETLAPFLASRDASQWITRLHRLHQHTPQSQA